MTTLIIIGIYIVLFVILIGWTYKIDAETIIESGQEQTTINVSSDHGFMPLTGELTVTSSNLEHIRYKNEASSIEFRNQNGKLLAQLNSGEIGLVQYLEEINKPNNNKMENQKEQSSTLSEKGLTIKEALDALAAGKKVKLPEWTGYWFNSTVGTPTCTIMVMTKNGDILDSPWLEELQDRKDWQITDGSLGFDWAINALKNGKKVARKGWNGKGMYLWLLPEDKVQRSWIKDPMLLEAFGDNEELNCLGSIRMKTATGEVLTGWLASQTDMLAEDWELVE